MRSSDPVDRPLEATWPKPVKRLARGARSIPYLFLALESGRPTGGSARICLEGVDEIVIGRAVERRVSRSVAKGTRVITLGVPDPFLSRAHARIRRHAHGMEISDLGSSNGTVLDGSAVSQAEVEDGAWIELGHTFFRFRTIAATEPADDILDGAEAEPGLATVLPPLEARISELVRCASTALSIVLRGPSGAGKDVVALIVHRLSKRPGPLVAVNCGAIPADLVESELFGHRRGAFSGAIADKIGLVATADRGTLFLDELGDLPGPAQPALLRALQDRAIRPVGETTTSPIDFRVVAATHRNLEAMVEAGTFREDLWSRIHGFSFELPALGARVEDFGTLVSHLFDHLCPDRDAALAPDAARAMLRYAWPRNIRELEKALEASLALAGDDVIDLHHLPPAIREGAIQSGVLSLPSEAELGPAHDDSPASPPAIPDPRRDQLAAALNEHGGNVSAVARALGKPRSQVQRWMRRWGLRATSPR